MIIVNYQDKGENPRRLNQETQRTLSRLVMLEKISIGNDVYHLKDSRIDVVQKNFNGGAKPFQFLFLSRKDRLEVGRPISMRHGSPELIEFKTKMEILPEDIFARVFIKPVEWVFWDDAVRWS